MPAIWNGSAVSSFFLRLTGSLPRASAFESAVAINPHLHGTKMRIHQLHRMIRKKSI